MNLLKGKGKDAVVRQKAEASLRKKGGEAEGLSEKDFRRLVHELQVHQVELEMQNDELLRAREDLEESRSKYADLYDFAPVGYFTLDGNGVVLEVNFRGAD